MAPGTAGPTGRRIQVALNKARLVGSWPPTQKPHPAERSAPHRKRCSRACPIRARRVGKPRSTAGTRKSPRATLTPVAAGQTAGKVRKRVDSQAQSTPPALTPLVRPDRLFLWPWTRASTTRRCRLLRPSGEGRAGSQPDPYLSRRAVIRDGPAGSRRSAAG